MTTGEKIKMLRVKKGMSQEKLGKKVGVQKAAINKYEKGIVVNLKMSTIAKLADALSSSVVSTKQPHNSGTQKVPESVENQCFRGFFHTFLSMMEKTISACFIP